MIILGQFQFGCLGQNILYCSYFFALTWFFNSGTFNILVCLLLCNVKSCCPFLWTILFFFSVMVHQSSHRTSKDLSGDFSFQGKCEFSLILWTFLVVGVFQHALTPWFVVIYCKLIPNWIKFPPDRKLFPSQYRTKLEILLGELFQKHYRVIRQPASLYLDYFIKTASILFSTRVFTRI